MIPPSFDYHAPTTLSEAVELLARYRDDAKVLSGGQSLLPVLKLRLAQPGHVVDIGRIPGLEYVQEEGGFLKIGGRTREATLERDAIVRSGYPILADTAAVIADPIVRNLATVGGNLAHADPANDHPATMLALGARVVARGPKGEREIAVEELFTGIYATVLEPDEILTEIRIPRPPPRTGGAYLKLERKVGDFATAGVAVHVAFSNGSVERAGIALTGVGATNIRAEAAEQALAGHALDDEAIGEAARLAAEAAEPRSDVRGSEEYKRNAIRVLTARGLRTAREVAQ